MQGNLKSVLLITLLDSAYLIFWAQMCFERIGLNYGTTLLSVRKIIAFIRSFELICSKDSSKKAIVSIIVFWAIFGLLFALPSVTNNFAVQIIIVILYHGCSIRFSTFVILTGTVDQHDQEKIIPMNSEKTFFNCQ